MNRHTPTHDYTRIADITLAIFVAVCALAPIVYWLGGLR